MNRRVHTSRLAFGLALAFAVASLPALGLFGPRALAEDKPAVKLNFPYLDAGRPDSATGSIIITKTLPDPAPMTERSQWIFDLRWERGDLYLLGVHALDLPAPQATPRAMGRFALELFEGPTVIERVRFDFPLMGAGEILDAGRRGMETRPPSFERKLTTRIGVMFPASKRGTKLELWDRATGARWTLPWPVTMPTTNAADATTEGG